VGPINLFDAGSPQYLYMSGMSPSAFCRSWTARESIMATTVTPWAMTRMRMNICWLALLPKLNWTRPEPRMTPVRPTPNGITAESLPNAWGGAEGGKICVARVSFSCLGLGGRTRAFLLCTTRALAGIQRGSQLDRKRERGRGRGRRRGRGRKVLLARAATVTSPSAPARPSGWAMVNTGRSRGRERDPKNYMTKMMGRMCVMLQCTHVCVCLWVEVNVRCGEGEGRGRSFGGSFGRRRRGMTHVEHCVLEFGDVRLVGLSD
jgi:hypothetical protein